ncbi:family 20 glycosylhydrolase [Sphingobacterium sp. lm-10]|uniref:family 20 glycosylhydrolase n=1 Tax=Sphingobacterium sp. lm-10 TaxID=2944904 RepID=UPI00202087AA|nr:family 20 glycosylhydrolase [Sphingobacterium sp. lm-10]MCL7989006.1 family 20 glycosylhydrolase [Sphingobacterium sp. lm-10]
MIKPSLFFSYFLLAVLHLSYAQQVKKGQDLPLIPYPQSVTTQQGFWSPSTELLQYYSDDLSFFEQEINVLTQQVFAGKTLQLARNAGSAQLLLLKDAAIQAEHYHLEITEKGVRLSAGTPSGMFYGLQSLNQLIITAKSDQALALPFMKVEDGPSFGWRGAHLDVARHFFSKEYIFRFIDLLALYKFNKFHFHLTDDQGWRLEIKKYPKLAEVGGWRTYNNHDTALLEKAKTNPDFDLPKEHLRERNGITEYGGYYTQDDIREILQYAQSRHIEVIPEIDMPGHMYMATKAYPELLLDTGEASWGKTFSTPICPCKEEAYTFVEHVLTEVMELFPSKYIHIGADEVEKDSWEKSPLCQALMKELNITDLDELQSYFVNRVNTFITKNGKQAIGWDEVLDGGVDTSMTVMYWRGWEKDAPHKAASRGHDVIMTPTNPLYFDFLPNSSSLNSVYHFRPIPSDLPQQDKARIMGAQANTWTEMIPSVARLEFMILPRLTALAERVWTNQELFASYQERIVKHYQAWQHLGYSFRMPDLYGFADQQVIVDGKAVLKVNNPLPSAKVYYTLDGSLPMPTSAVLDEALVVREPSQIRFASITESGAKSELYQVDFKRDSWKKPVKASVKGRKNGLLTQYYADKFPKVAAIQGEVAREEVLANVHMEDTISMPSFAAKLRGFIRAPKDGIYSFYFTCDDGGVLRIADQMVVDNDGNHSPIMKSGQIALKKGLHDFAIDFIEAGGGFTLELKYSVDGGDVQPIPDDWFYQP